ncbi:MAG: glutamate racemase [Treponema sp.]|nr:glutamate racemase [Treponema sp.]
MSVNFAFLDSGVGGLPYLDYLKKLCSAATCVYVADTKNFPYGEKSKAQIEENACLCAEKIIKKWNPKVIVVACNTISVTALEELRKRFPKTPFVGTVPAIKPAAQLSKTRKIGLLATNATVNHTYTKKLIEEFASDCTIVSRGDPDLISFIEHKFNSASEQERLDAVMPAVDFFKSKDCDCIVLACTHFLNMTEYFKKAGGGAVIVVDSLDGVVRHALEVEKTVFSENYAQAEPWKEGCGSFLYVTGFTSQNDSLSYKKMCARLGMNFGGVLE